MGSGITYNINKELFIKIHPFIKNVAIDLNALPKNYLPIKVNGITNNLLNEEFINKYNNVIENQIPIL